VLVFGSESRGLPPSLLEQHPERLLRIPIRPQVRSLNLSNAVAVAVFEALRQGAGSPPAQ
jgi:tRNA (cytidine/uridine-2'-O-)-methyltransferase